ncbi:MAG: hypothetical protein JJ956_05805, partial [Pseudomonadales bacterium]|nr:hypothetical protein [Pseudomonadales bacterium]
VAATVEVAQGGADESEFVIFDLTAGALGVAQTDLVNMTAPVALPFSGTASVAMTVYETLTQAVNEQESLYSISGSFATLTTGVLVTTVAEGAVAEVSEDFLAFSDGAGGTTDTGNFGTIQYAANPVAVEADDTAVVTADSITDADLTITLGGLDMGWGTYFLDADGNCDDVANRTAIALATDELSASVANVVGIDATPHAICAIAGGTEEIPESTLTADLEWTTVATAVAPLADTSDVVGSITRNGTTVQIPYLTTFEDYNQRIVLVNRHSQDADYTITFRGEDGVTWTAGEKATGEIPQGEVLSVRARDVVTITGATRIAATVTVVAPSAVVDVATNQVNLSDGSTDTVVYTP